MWFCPLQIIAFVYIRMHAANLDPTQYSSSKILSITAMAVENSAFVWIAFTQSNLPSTNDCQNCLNTYSLVYWVFHLIRHLANFSLFSRHRGFSVLPMLPKSRGRGEEGRGGILYACPPITGPGSKCQNII